MGSDLPLVIGLDVGTSNVKAAVFGGEERGVVVVRPLATAATGATGLESVQRPEAIRGAVIDALSRAVASIPHPPAAIAVSCAMHGVSGVDAHGEPVLPLVTWADQRATGVVDDWKARRAADFIHARTGVPLHPMAPVAKLAWFARNEPKLVDRVVCWVDLKALVISWLTGEVMTEVSSASGWGMMDIRSHVWDPEATRLAGVDTSVLPPIATPTMQLPLDRGAAEAIGCRPGTPVVLGGADGPLGNVGVGAIEPGVAGVSLGTSGAVRVVVDTPPPLIPGLFCYALTEDRWVLGGAVSNGGNVAEWLAETFLGSPARHHEDRLDDLMSLAATVPPGSDGLVMLPYLLGERAPTWEPTIPGAYLGLRRRHTRAHLARAGIEGVCAAMGVILERIDTHEPIARVLATGGTMTDRLWRECLAGALGRPMAVVDAEAGSALGATAVGLTALGVAGDLAQARALLERPGHRPEPIDVGEDLRAAAVDTRRRIGASAAQIEQVASAYR